MENADTNEMDSRERRDVFAKNLRALRIRKGMNQSELARQMSTVLGREVGRYNVSYYENARCMPSRPRLEAIAKVLECESADLLPDAHALRGAAYVFPSFSMTSAPGNMYHVVVNQTLPADAAIKIAAIVNDCSPGASDNTDDNL